VTEVADWLPRVSADEEVDRTALARSAGHPDLTECLRTASLLNDFADACPCEASGDRALHAMLRAVECAHAVAEDRDTSAMAHQARSERAALTLGLLESEGPLTRQRLAALDPETYELLEWYAAPWPIEWLFPPVLDFRGRPVLPRIVVLFSGPGGLTQGILRILRARADVIGVDLDPGACATSRAAGFRVIQADVTALDPEHPCLQHVVGIVVTAPCPAFSPAGRRLGHHEDAIRLIEDTALEVAAAGGFFPWQDSPTGYAPRTGLSWDEVREPLEALADPRAGLMAEVVIWPLAMLARGGGVEWVAVEQSSALPQRIEDALIGRLREAGWHTAETWTLDAADYGSASHRRRKLMAVYRGEKPFVDLHPSRPFPVTTFAEVVGWPAGRTVLTRGRRPLDPVTGRAKGGGSRSADRPSTCVTATAYAWQDSVTGERIAQEDIGRLIGFPEDYPWRHVGRGRGVRAKAQQAADVVCPMVAAALFGRILGDPCWEDKVRAYVAKIYGKSEVHPDVGAAA
jgi:site-specific DNA-cytosine methylase